jgi:hypothetical protein
MEEFPTRLYLFFFLFSQHVLESKSEITPQKPKPTTHTLFCKKPINVCSLLHVPALWSLIKEPEFKKKVVQEDTTFHVSFLRCRRLRLKCDGTRAETRFRLSAKRTSPFKSAGGVSSVDYLQPRCAHQRQ